MMKRLHPTQLTNEESKVHLGDIHRMSIKQKQEEQNMKEKYCRSISLGAMMKMEDDDELEELMRIRAARRKKGTLRRLHKKM